MILDTTSLIMVILIAITIIITSISLGVTISNKIRDERLLRNIYKNFVDRWIKRKKGKPDYCDDSYGLAIYEFFKDYHKKKTKNNMK